MAQEMGGGDNTVAEDPVLEVGVLSALRVQLRARATIAPSRLITSQGQPEWLNG